MYVFFVFFLRDLCQSGRWQVLILVTRLRLPLTKVRVQLCQQPWFKCWAALVQQPWDSASDGAGEGVDNRQNTFWNFSLDGFPCNLLCVFCLYCDGLSILNPNCSFFYWVRSADVLRIHYLNLCLFLWVLHRINFQFNPHDFLYP